MAIKVCFQVLSAGDEQRVVLRPQFQKAVFLNLTALALCHIPLDD